MVVEHKKTRGKTEGIVARSKLRELLRQKIPDEQKDRMSIGSDAVEELHRHIEKTVNEICEEAVKANYTVVKHFDVERGITKYNKTQIKHALEELDTCLVGLTQLKIRLTGEA
jgi:histone H3/H4